MPSHRLVVVRHREDEGVAHPLQRDVAAREQARPVAERVRGRDRHQNVDSMQTMSTNRADRCRGSSQFVIQVA
jgi:hypothetical protein